MENHRIQMKIIEFMYKYKILDTNENFYNTNGKDQILQRLACHTTDMFRDVAFHYLVFANLAI